MRNLVAAGLFGALAVAFLVTTAEYAFVALFGTWPYAVVALLAFAAGLACLVAALIHVDEWLYRRAFPVRRAP